MTDSESQHKRRFECLLSAVNQLVLQLNGSGEVTHVYAGKANWLNAEKIMGRTFSALFSELADDVSSLIDQALVTHVLQTKQLIMKPEHLLHWRELGLPSVQTWDLKVIATSATELMVVIEDLSESKRLEQKVSHQAQRDPLTGAYNRRALMTILDQSVAQAQRYDWICSFLLIDVDQFSQINDQYGWDAGDKVLQSFVTAIHGFKRTADFFARFSDDRFVMFLPETNREQGQLAAERVRKLASELDIPYATGNLSFTVSIGVATLRDMNDTPEIMLKRAEEHLFIAKQSGTNRIEGEAS
jgi:diguanylate cyclase (GGDEF)-like protein